MEVLPVSADRSSLSSKAFVPVASVLCLFASWALLSAWTLVLTDALLNPWDAAPASALPPAGTVSAVLHDVFTRFPTAFLPTLLILAVSMGLFLRHAIQTRRLARLALRFAAINVALVGMGALATPFVWSLERRLLERSGAALEYSFSRHAVSILFWMLLLLVWLWLQLVPTARRGAGRRAFLGFGAMVALGLVTLLVAGYPARGASEIPQLLVEKSIGSIHYGAYFDRDEQRVYGEVTFDYFTTEGVQEYIAFNRNLAQELAQRSEGPLRVRVNFGRPLSEDEFEAFVGDYDLEVHSYFMRAVEAEGWRVGIGGAPENGQLVPHSLLDMAVSDVEGRNGAEFKGWAYVDVTTDPTHLRAMLSDPNVVIIEGADTLIYDALTPAALRRAGAYKETIRKIQIHPDVDGIVQITGPGLYWHLEDLGLVPMPVHSSQEDKADASSRG
jgi:hypothetical protein